MSGTWKITKIIFLVGLMLTGLFFLNGASQASQISAIQDSHETPHLNIALVNSDKGVLLNGARVNLGQSYANRVSQDNDNTWFAVSQGVGESGLKNGSYQLLVEIPPDFSSKVLDVHSEAPQASRITYAVADTSDVNIQATANTIGVQSISDLNTTLVNMYFASVIDNLSTAQSNVNKLVSNQEKNISKYQSSVFPTIQTLQTTMPTLSSNVEMANSTNETLRSQFKSTDALNKSLLQTQSAFHDNFVQTLEDHQASRLTDKQFYDTLAAMQPDVLSEQVNTALAQLSESNARTNDIIQSSDDTDASEALDNLTSALDDLVERNSSLKDETAERNQKSLTVLNAILSVKANYKDSMAQKLGLAKNIYGTYPNMTIGDLLKLQSTNPAEQTSIAQFNTLADTLDTQVGNRLSVVKSDLADLPYATNEIDLLTNGISGVPTATLLQIQNEIASHNAGVNTAAHPDWIIDLGTAGTSQKAKDLVQERSDAKDNGEDLTESNGKIEQQYEDFLKELDAALSADSGNSTTNGDQVRALLDIPIDDYLDTLVNDAIISKLGTDASEPLTDTSGETFTVSDLIAQLSGSSPAQTQLNDQLEAVLSKYKGLQDQQSDLSAKIQDQISQFQKLQTDVTVLNGMGDVAKQSADTSDKSMQSSSEELKSLLVQSEDTKDESEQQSKEAESTASQMKDFVKVMDSTSKTSGEVQKSANGALKTFDNETSTNKLFAKTFAGVLSNASNKGVENDSVISFLANPVAGEAQTEKGTQSASIEVTPWLLILYAVSLFLSFALRNSRIFGKRRSDIDSSHLRWKVNTRAIAWNLGFHVVLGLVFALLSFKGLSLDVAAIPHYTLLILLISLFYGAINGYLVRQFSLAGLGVGIFVLMSEMFILNIANDSSTPLIAALSTANPINFSATVLTGVLSNTGSMLTGIMLMVAITIIGIGLNMVVVDFSSLNLQKRFGKQARVRRTV